MKTHFKLSAILIFALLISNFACQSNKTMNQNMNQTVDKQTYKSIGVVKAIDETNGKITVDHEDIVGYMSAMQMNEYVRDRAILKGLKIGDKIDFEIERTGEKIIITKLNKIGEVSVINGSELYQTNCAACHGANGEGAKKGIPLISGHALAHSEDEYIEQIKNGEGKKMSAFKDKLSQEEIKELVKFVREEIQKSITPEQREHHHH